MAASASVVFRVRVEHTGDRARTAHAQAADGGQSQLAGRRRTAQLRLRLPSTAKAGAYRLRLTVRDASGHAKSFAPSLRIPR